MRGLLGILFAAWLLCPSGATACGLSGPWYVSSDDGYTGIFVIEKVIDDASCETRLNVFSALGVSAVEACRVLRSDNNVIYCEIISTSFFFGGPDNFVLEDQGEVLKGRWMSDISGWFSQGSRLKSTRNHSMGWASLAGSSSDGRRPKRRSA